MRSVTEFRWVASRSQPRLLTLCITCCRISRVTSPVPFCLPTEATCRIWRRILELKVRGLTVNRRDLQADLSVDHVECGSDDGVGIDPVIAVDLLDGARLTEAHHA